MKTLFGEANNLLYNNGWTQEEIGIILFGTTEEAQSRWFRGRE